MEWILGGSTPNLSFKKKKKRGEGLEILLFVGNMSGLIQANRPWIPDSQLDALTF